MIVVRTKFSCRAFWLLLQFDRLLWRADTELTARTTCSVCGRAGQVSTTMLWRRSSLLQMPGLASPSAPIVSARC